MKQLPFVLLAATAALALGACNRGGDGNQANGAAPADANAADANASGAKPADGNAAAPAEGGDAGGKPAGAGEGDNAAAPAEGGDAGGKPAGEEGAQPEGQQ